MPTLAGLTANRNRQAAHGLDHHADEHWSRRAFCATDPDFWQVDDLSPKWHLVAQARHGCLAHCPVRDLCARDTPPIRSTVVAGVYYNRSEKPGHYQPHADSCRHCRPGGA